MLDVHILKIPTSNQRWLAQAIASVDTAAKLAEFPVTVHVIDGIVGHLGKSRRKGYSQGTHPWVTYVDHDDYLHPQAFVQLTEYLKDKNRAITTGEFRLSSRKGIYPRPNDKHHLAVFPRTIVDSFPLEKFEFLPDQMLLQSVPQIHIPKCLYYHRIYQNSASRVQRKAKQEAALHEANLLNRHQELIAVELMSYEQIAHQYDNLLGEV